MVCIFNLISSLHFGLFKIDAFIIIMKLIWIRKNELSRINEKSEKYGRYSKEGIGYSLSISVAFIDDMRQWTWGYLILSAIWSEILTFSWTVTLFRSAYAAKSFPGHMILFQHFNSFNIPGFWTIFSPIESWRNLVCPKALFRISEFSVYFSSYTSFYQTEKNQSHNKDLYA